MTKRKHDEYSARRELQDADFRVQQADVIKFNTGNESLKHAMCKLLAGYILRERGYRIDSEVENPGGEVDILAYAGPDQDCFVVECETNPTDEVVTDKLERYVHGRPPRDMFLLNVTEMPSDMFDAYKWIRGQL